MSFKQCAAIRPNGDKCRRVAADGSEYCHSHRTYTPKHRAPPIEERLAEHFFKCEWCQHLIRPDASKFFPMGDFPPGDIDQPLCPVLCSPCFRLWCRIEERLIEICAPPGCSDETAIADLGNFGVEREMVMSVLRRLHATGQLVRT